MIEIVLNSPELHVKRKWMSPPITECIRPYFGEKRATYAGSKKWKRSIELDLHEWLVSYNIEYELFDRVDLNIRAYVFGIRFSNKEDAMLFKLTWC